MTIKVEAQGAPKAAVEPNRQGNTNEAVPQVATPEPAKADPMSPKFAALAKKERQLNAERERLKSEREALNAEKNKYQSGYYSKEQLLKDPLSVLGEVGLNYNALTEKILNSNQPTDPVIQELLQQVKQLQESQTRFQTEAEKLQTQQYEQAVNQIRMDVKSQIENGQDFPLIQTTEAVEDVVELIKAVFDEEKRIMTVEEACKEVEDYLTEEALKIAAVEKIKSKILPPKVEPEVQFTAQKTQQKQQQQKTLSSAVTTNAKPLSARERAILAMQGKLN